MFRWAFVPLATAALLLPGTVLGQIADAVELSDLEVELESLAYGSHNGHHHHTHRHLRHHQHHPHLRHHKRASLFAAAPPTQIAAHSQASSENLLPGRHHAVAQKLGNMEQEIRTLGARQQAASTARSSLEDNVHNAIFHMNEAVGIKRELARTEARLRAEEIKLKKFEEDRLRLDRTHGHLVSSLHHIMEPKIEFAETRLKQTEKKVHNLEAKAGEWKAKENKYHETSLAVLEKRRETKKRLEAADEAVSKARHEQEESKRQLESVKHNVAFNVEAYKYARTRARAAESEEERGRRHLQSAQVSEKRLSGILTMEQKRVDESMAVGKDRVQGKMRELESSEEKSKAKISELSTKYREWQNSQRTWARRVAAAKQASHATSQNFAVEQQLVLDKAQAKVAYEAESDSDWAWDEWPGASKRDTDEVALSAI